MKKTSMKIDSSIKIRFERKGESLYKITLSGHKYIRQINRKTGHGKWVQVY